MTDLPNLALKKAQAILDSECSPIGLMASPEGYPHVWARDSVITSLGTLFSPGHENCLKVSLRTLAGQQSELGAIPNKVSVATGRLDHTNAGSVDSNLWFILGHAFQMRAHPDKAFLMEQWPALEKALLWLRYQDSNGCGLLEVHEAADWADLLANRFNVLYDSRSWPLNPMASRSSPVRTTLPNSGRRQESIASSAGHAGAAYTSALNTDPEWSSCALVHWMRTGASDPRLISGRASRRPGMTSRTRYPSIQRDSLHKD